MRIAITGHLKKNSLGAALFNFLSKDHDCFGFDLFNGYDIDRDIDKIIQESKDCDIFINNAYYYNRQSDLAREWHKEHFDKDHLLINISSMISHEFLDTEKIFPHLSQHVDHKKNLNKISWDINSSGSKSKSILIMPGILNTGFSTPWDHLETSATTEYWTDFVNRGTIIEPDDVVEVVDFVIKHKNSRCLLSTIHIQNR